MFNVLELMFNALEHMFNVHELMFNGLEHKYSTTADIKAETSELLSL